jgi:murein DD-endopeptidase MepM/ murein hydrolase activator NlpD
MRELTYFPLLVSYPKTSGYGYRIDPITGAQSSFHRGVDYGAPFGVPVIAPFDGQVTTGYESGAGNWLWVDDGNGSLFKSFHHDAFLVTGGWVEAGTEIATIDSTGSSTGSHAHLELWDWGMNIDPTGYLDRAPLRDGGHQENEDEMTDEDWNQMRSMLNNFIVGKLAMHSTPTVLITDDNGQFCIVMKDGRPHRYGMHSPAEVTLAQRAGFVAPQKPVNPPEPCPTALHVNELTQAERDILYSYPHV